MSLTLLIIVAAIIEVVVKLAVLHLKTQIGRNFPSVNDLHYARFRGLHPGDTAGGVELPRLPPLLDVVLVSLPL